MKFVRTKFEKPITGTGVVKVGEKTFTINLEYKDEKGNVQEDKFTFKLSDIPETLPDGWEPKSGKEYFVSVSADGGTLLNIRPAKGTFTVRCDNLSETKDGDYLLLQREGQYGPYSQFVPLLTVQDGPHKGIDYPIYLPYSSGDTARFANEDGLMAVVGNPEKSKPIAALFDWITYTGIADMEIPYPEDDDEPNDDPQEILGTLHKAVKKAKQKFTLLVENGYPKALSEIDEDDEPAEKDEPAESEPADEVDEKPKDKKKKPKWDED